MNEIVAKITITLHKSGQLEISGPTHERMLFLGMVELAKATVLSQGKTSPILTPGDVKG